MKEFFINHLRKFCFISLIIIIVAEIFIFNYKSFLIHPFNSSEYQQQSFSIADAEISGLSYSQDSNVYIVTSNNPTITFYMDTPVETMFFDASLTNALGKELQVSISYATESYKNLKTSNKVFSITEAVPNSKYVTCSYFGKVHKIMLTISAESDTTIQINGFSVNKHIPMHFSITRIFVLFLFSCILYIFLKYPAFRENLDMTKRSHRFSVRFTLISFILLIIFIYNIYIGDYEWSENITGNQMTQELVDAFERGQVHLVDEVPKELLELENPYDWSERIGAGLSYKWDHLLYEGKYYSYYGIAPVLTLFLPYHVITGYYFDSSLACLIYSLFAALFLGLCFLSIVRNWFGKTPLRIVILGMITTMFSSCVLICVLAAQFYEIAQSSALCFLAIGFYFMLNSGIFMKQSIRLSYLFLSSLFVSLSVLCRATCAVYAITMVCWIVYGYTQYMKDKHKDAASTIKYIAASISPYIVFALIQMTYNYLRFGNPLEFGIKYTLTIYDYINIDMHFSLIMVSVINMIFTIPVVNTTFPFIHDNFDSLNVNGYYFVATRPAFGVLPSVLPVFALFYAPKLAKNFNVKEKIRLALIWLMPGIIFPIILAAMTWEYGYAMRYNADFGWQLCLAAFVVILYVYNRLENKTLKEWLFRLLFIATIWCSVCYLAGAFTSNPINSVAENADGAELYYKIRNLIAFWN